MQAAFFDLDKTIIARSSGLAFGRDLYREGFISKRLLLRGIAAQIVYLLVGANEEKMEKMREKVLRLTKGWEKAKMESLINEVMGEVIQPIIYKEALQLIGEHQAAGRKVFIVSSSPEEIVIPLCRLIGADEAIASRARVDDEGRYIGELEFYCYGPFKTQAILDIAAREEIDLAESYAYSDSITDIPMLKAVGHPVAVNPDRALRREAVTRGWDVRWFENPVKLRKRLAEFAPPREVALPGSAAALGLVALGGIWWIRRRSRRERENSRPHSFIRV